MNIWRLWEEKVWGKEKDKNIISNDAINFMISDYEMMIDWMMMIWWLLRENNIPGTSLECSMKFISKHTDYYPLSNWNYNDNKAHDDIVFI